MNVTKKVALVAAALAVIAALVAKLPISGGSRPTVREGLSIRGAVVQDDSDATKQLPISGVDISADDNAAASATTSDSSGFFSLSLRPELRPGTRIVLKLRNSDYKPLDLNVAAGDQLYVAHMTPVRAEAQSRGPV